MIGITAAAFLCAQPAVTDGDSLICADRTRVRIWGIDAPERHEPEGPASTRALARIVRGHDLRCQPKGRSHNRVVARCFLGSLDIGGEMVRGGFAQDWPKFSGGLYSR